MKKPKVTIILPCLNVAAYIGATLESALCQSLREIEIICVDAGSTDGTLDIIHKYETRSEKAWIPFRLLKSDVKSYGHQINLALAEAKGKYVAILETDDIAAPKMYEDLYNLGEKYGAEIVKSTYFDYMGAAPGTIRLSDGRTIPGAARPSLFSAIRAPKGAFKIIKCPELLIHHPSVWSALYRRSFLEEKNVKMPEIPGAGWADNPFMMESLLKAEKIVYTSKPYYYYRKDNPSSSTALKNCRMPFERIGEMRLILDRLISKDTEDYNLLLKTLYHRAINYCVDAMNSPALDPEKDGELIKKILGEIPEKYLEDGHITKTERQAYNFFTGRKVPETFAYRINRTFYIAKYGFTYVWNNLWR